MFNGKSLVCGSIPIPTYVGAYNWDWVGAPRRSSPTIRSNNANTTRPNPLPKSRGGRGGWGGWYPYWGYPYYYGYPYWGYPYNYDYDYEYYNRPQQPDSPEEIYGMSMTQSQVNKYCRGLYDPYCQYAPNSSYCQYYKQFCTPAIPQVTPQVTPPLPQVTQDY